MLSSNPKNKYICIIAVIFLNWLQLKLHVNEGGGFYFFGHNFGLYASTWFQNREYLIMHETFVGKSQLSTGQQKINGSINPSANTFN